MHRFSSYLDLPTHYSTLTALLSVFAGEDSPKEHVMEAGPWTTWDLTKIPILGRYRGLQPKSWGKDSIASISFVIGTPGRWLRRKPFLCPCEPSGWETILFFFLQLMPGWGKSNLLYWTTSTVIRKSFISWHHTRMEPSIDLWAQAYVPFSSWKFTFALIHYETGTVDTLKESFETATITSFLFTIILISFLVTLPYGRDINNLLRQPVVDKLIRLIPQSSLYVVSAIGSSPRDKSFHLNLLVPGTIRNRRPGWSDHVQYDR